jgi:hypothetical protein
MKQDKFPSSVCGYLIIPSEDESFDMINNSYSYQIFGKVNSISVKNLSIREHRNAKTQRLGFLLDLSFGLDLARQHFHNNAHLNCGYSYTRKAFWTSELKPCYWNLELFLDKNTINSLRFDSGYEIVNYLYGFRGLQGCL